METLGAFISDALSEDEKATLVSQSTAQNRTGDIQYGTLTEDEDAPLLIEVHPKLVKGNRCCTYLRTLTIEPFLFLFVFGFMLNRTTITNLMMDKGCLYYFNYSLEVCQNLSNHTKEKTEVEVLANDYTLYANLLSFIAAFTMIFISPWSDKYGRKPPMILATFAFVVSDILTVLCAYHFDSKLIYIVLARIPSEIFGGFICILKTIFSLASEGSSEKGRTLKYTVVELALFMGLYLAMIVAGLVYQYCGYVYIYLLATVFHLLCVLWIVFVVEETRGIGVEATPVQKLRDVFDCTGFVRGWKTTFRARKGNERLLLLLFFASVCVVFITYESSITYLFMNHFYDWDLPFYNNVTTIFGLGQMATMIIFVPLVLKVFKINDYVIGLVGVASMMMKNLLIAFGSYNVYIYYAGNAFGGLSNLVSLALRSGISKLVDKEEIGRIFSFLSTIEAIFPMLATAALAKLFNATINITPSITFLTIVYLLLVPLGTLTWAYIMSRRRHYAFIRQMPQGSQRAT